MFQKKIKLFCFPLKKKNLALWFLFSINLFCFTNCQPYKLNNSANTESPIVQQSIEITGNKKVDILMVIDNSSSMRLKQNNVIQNMTHFFSTLSQFDIDMHLGLITTDCASSLTPTPLITSSQTNSTAQVYNNCITDHSLTDTPLAAGDANVSGSLLPIYCDPEDSQCHNTDRYLSLSSTLNANIQQFQYLLTRFSKTVSEIGTLGSSMEMGLLSTLRVLIPQTQSVINNNQGFLRSDADLAIIFVTDEDDCSMALENDGLDAHRVIASIDYSQSSSCYIRESSNLLMPVTTILNQLLTIKDISRLKMALIGGGTMQGTNSSLFNPSGCLLSYSDQTAPSNQCGCWALPENRNNTSQPVSYFCDYLSQYNQQTCSSTAQCPTQTSSSTNNLSHLTCLDPNKQCLLACDTMPASRYHQLIQLLKSTQIAQSVTPYIQESSICDKSFSTSLSNIAQEVVSSNCLSFTSALDSNNIAVTISHLLSDGSRGSPNSLPYQLPPSDNSNCSIPGWYIPNTSNSSICWSCSSLLQQSDILYIESYLKH